MPDQTFRRGLQQVVAPASLLFAVACTEVPEFTTLDTPLPQNFALQSDAVMPRQVDVIWWRHLNDPVIDTLVQTIYAQNLTLSVAALRVEEAEALRGTTSQSFSVSGDTSLLGRQDLEADTDETGLASNMTATWLLDPFGRLAASRATSANDVVIAKAELASARNLVLANLLNSYVDLRFQQARRANLLAEIDRRRATISRQQSGGNVGEVTEIELTNARAALAESRSALPLAEAEIARLNGQIAVLAGTAPGTLDVDLDSRRQQPVPVELPTAGLPADLLRNRADLFLLERNYYAARLELVQTRADFYPTLSLGGSLAISAFDETSSIATFGPRITLPALPNGPVRGRVAAAEVRVQIAFQEWEAAVLTAVSDAEAALLTLQANAKALQEADRQVALSRRALELTARVLAFNGATLDDITAAEDRVANAQTRQATLRGDLARAFIDAQVQLGSGEVLALTTRSQAE